MANSQKRERTADAAATRAAGENAAFGVMSGTMILGALLAPRDPAHATPVLPEPQEADAARSETGTHSVPATTISPDSTALPVGHGDDRTSEQAAPQALLAVPEPTHTGSVPLASDGPGSADFQSGQETIVGSGAASTQTAPSESTATDGTHSSAADLPSSLNSMVDGLETNLNHTLDALLGSTSELSALWQQTATQIDHTIGELIGTVGNLANPSSLLDLGHTLDGATGGIVDAFEIPAASAEQSAHTTSSVDVSAAMSAIADLASSLVGVTRHNDTLDQAYGTPSQQNTAPADTHFADAMDIGSLTTADTGPLSIGFMGQSYTDAFDTHDVTHHASHTLHGLV